MYHRLRNCVFISFPGHQIFVKTLKAWAYFKRMRLLWYLDYLLIKPEPPEVLRSQTSFYRTVHDLSIQVNWEKPDLVLLQEAIYLEVLSYLEMSLKVFTGLMNRLYLHPVWGRS